MNELRREIAERLRRHRESLAGWEEGRACSCCGVMGPRPGCTACLGTGIEAGSAGHLVPTEPDRCERYVSRLQLQAAVSELEAVLALMEEIGEPSIYD